MLEPLAPGLPRRVWSVSELIVAISDLLATRFASCSVRGELSGFARAASGHCYFSLKDADAATLRCVMFRRAAMLLDFAPRDGQLVELRGRVTLYEPRGELQFVAESMQATGAGALYEQFLRSKAKLEAEGLFDAANKRALPPFPRRIGVITSPAAAALQDVLTALARRAAHVHVVLYPSPVQGADAAQGLVRALRLAGKRAEVDALIVCRGGGSLEDLWAYNDERVARAIAACPIPVISGVGHETDVTLADLAADLRATTPTAAAEHAAPSRQAMLDGLSQFGARLMRAAGLRLEAQQQRLDRVSLRLARPDETIARQGFRIALLAGRLAQSATSAVVRRRSMLERSWASLGHVVPALLAQREHRLQQLGARLASSDPRQVLARGYALIHTPGGALVLRARQIQAGSDLHLTLALDEADVTVASVRSR